MKISRRRYEKKNQGLYWQGLKEGQEQGRQEVMDIACGWIGKARAQTANDPIAYNTLLHTQAFLEGQRLLSYLYDETPDEEAAAFFNRFIEARKINSSKDLLPMT